MQIRYRRATPQLVGFDTETTGLHIMKDKPFLMIFGYIGARGEREVYTCDLELNPTIAHSFLDMMYHLCSTAPYVYAWNTKYDLHMLCNYGKPYPHRNLADGQTLVRLTQMADDNTSGITALKSVAKRYVTKDADTDQQLVKFVNETPWGLIRNVELLRLLEKRLEERETWQGRLLKATADIPTASCIRDI